MIVLTVFATCIDLASAISNTGTRISPPADRSMMLVQTSVSPFAGGYRGSYGFMTGNVTISESGKVSGYFFRYSRTGREELRFSGGITDDGIMRISGRYSYAFGRGEKGTAHLQTTADVTLNDDGSLTVSWADGQISTWYRL